MGCGSWQHVRDAHARELRVEGQRRLDRQRLAAAHEELERALVTEFRHELELTWRRRQEASMRHTRFKNATQSNYYVGNTPWRFSAEQPTQLRGASNIVTCVLMSN